MVCLQAEQQPQESPEEQGGDGDGGTEAAAEPYWRWSAPPVSGAAAQGNGSLARRLCRWGWRFPPLPACGPGSGRHVRALGRNEIRPKALKHQRGVFSSPSHVTCRWMMYGERILSWHARYGFCGFGFRIGLGLGFS